ncbi:MAG: YHS domain-containing protein [Candidatus Lokiarchaeota archaeon]|nr:YHS domain-containing protein [Candidatus Lokiarchaeota archaeon]
MIEKDPVCNKVIDTDKEYRHARYRVRDFYFCSDKCTQEFERNPDFYTDLAVG